MENIRMKIHWKSCILIFAEYHYRIKKVIITDTLSSNQCIRSKKMIESFSNYFNTFLTESFLVLGLTDVSVEALI